jgi:hypothetical protein
MSALNLSYVTSPANNAVNRNTTLNITANNVPGASEYTIQLSEFHDFQTIAFEMTDSTRTLAFTGLHYNTLYYNRVGTNLASGFGEVRSFTTRTAESLTYVTSPANGAVNRNTTLTITSSNVPGAGQYTIQLSEVSNFLPIAFEVTGPTRSLAFTGLKGGTTYYNRVLTDQTIVFGEIRSFTTKGSPPASPPPSSKARLASDSKANQIEYPKEFSVEVFPNPFREKLTFIIYTPNQQMAEVALMDLNGRVVHKSIQETNTAAEIKEEMTSGIYILKVQTSYGQKVLRVLKIE